MPLRTLDILTIKYLRKARKTIFDKNTYQDRTAEDEYKSRLERFFFWCIKKKLIPSKEDLDKMDTIDISRINKRDTYNSGSDLPSMILTQEEKKKISDCWYLIIPPFEEGVLKINKNRYIKYYIPEIDEEKHTYGLYLEDYALDKGIWMADSKSASSISWDQDKNQLIYQIKGNLGSVLITNTLEQHKDEWDQDNLLYFKEVMIPCLKSVEEDNDLDILVTHFFVAIAKTNLQLQEGKPKAIRGSGKIKTSAGDLDKNPKPRITRVTSGGIKLISVKAPKASSEETIRKYHIEAWRTRGHVRHYKNGKTVWIKESVHHRKCLRTDEEMKIPQNIIIAS